MKNIFQIFFLFFFANGLFSQSFPVHADDPEWSFIKCYNQELVSVTTLPDTLIEENWWTPLERTDSYWTTPKYYRVDDQKVYFWTEESQSGQKEFLMYDFSLEVGDSVYVGIPGSMFLIDSLLFVVSASDTLFFGETPRKYLLGASYPEVYEGMYVQVLFAWVEGIGDIFHPFYPAYCLFQQGDVGGPCSGCESFVCLTTDAAVLFTDPNDDTCNYPESSLTRIYVDQNVSVTSPQNGSSWQYAFDDLREAINLAEPGDSIWVAEGTYFPTSYTNREFSFHLNPGVKIFGGFNGTETELSQRDLENHETILSGDIGVQGDSTDNSYHVVYTIGTDSTAVLDGFTITRGYAMHDNNAYFGHLVRGGGMVVDTNEEFPEASPLIRNCNFKHNVGKYGGGLACFGLNNLYANPTLINCTFFQNTGVIEGGGIYKTGPSFVDHPMYFENCVFEDNWAWQGGAGIMLKEVCNDFIFKSCIFLKDSVVSGSGGVYLYSICDDVGIQMEDCSFVENEGNVGGGLGLIDDSVDNEPHVGFDFEFVNCSFIGNSDYSNEGGALYFRPWYSPCKIKIDQCNFENNFSFFQGGAIDVETAEGSESYLNISNSIFSGNYSIAVPASGAIHLWGAVFADDLPASYSKIENSIFYGNRGALGVSSGPGLAEMELDHCTFFDNGNYPIAKNWGPNFNYVDNYTIMSLANCILWEPEVPLYYLFYNGNPTNQNLYDYTIDNCLISPSACDLPGGDEACNEGMIFGLNPMFVNATAGDLRVGGCSPAINAGDVSFSPDIITDINGNPRILEGIPDMGAYERETFWLNFVGADGVSCPGIEDGKVFFETNGDAPLNYFWEMGFLTDTTSTGLISGQYFFTVTDAAGCQDTFTIMVPEADTLQATYQIQDASAVNAWDGALTLQNISGGTPPYQWFWNTEDTTASLENIPPGWYVLNLLDANDCWYTYNFEVGWVTAIGEISGKEKPTLFPNPVKQGQPLELNLPSSGTCQIHVFDATGRRFPILKTVKNDVTIQINTDSWPAGLYLLHLEDENGRVWFFKQLVYY